MQGDEIQIQEDHSPRSFKLRLLAVDTSFISAGPFLLDPELGLCSSYV